MTKEEFMERYKENLLRLWDSLRTEHKGEKDCVGVMCRDCPFYNKKGICHIYTSIDIVENWAKEHPIKTNSQKFEEVFGFKPFTNACVKGEIKCKDCEYNDYGVCNASRFWDAEYNEKTKEGEE